MGGIFAANNIARVVRHLARRGDTGLDGIICVYKKAALPVFPVCPKESRHPGCELECRAVVEHSPNSKGARIFRELAHAIMEKDSRVIPTPVNDLRELERMYWGARRVRKQEIQ